MKKEPTREGQIIVVTTTERNQFVLIIVDFLIIHKMVNTSFKIAFELRFSRTRVIKITIEFKFS